MNSLQTLRLELDRLSDPKKGALAQRFFKTGPGQYGEGDRFRGIKVPETRALAKTYRHLPFADAAELLESEWHEDRQLALFLLIELHRKGDAALRAKIHALYLARIGTGINNWDLVDASAEHLAGGHLAAAGSNPGDTALLDALAGDKNLWKRRVAMVATHHFIKRREFAPTLRIAERLLGDGEDLIHKAAGWMLREAGKRDEAILRGFLDRHAASMPRTLLRYAIERLPEAARKKYMDAGRGL